MTGKRLLTAMLLAAAPLVMAACGGEASTPGGGGGGASAPATTAAVTTPADPAKCQGATLAFLGLAGEEGDKELKAWRKEHGLTLKVTSSADWGQLIGALRAGQPYDLASIPYRESQRMIRAGIFQPIAVERLTNWKDLYPAFNESPLLRGEDGKVYGVPIAWGDSPFIYVPARVPDPPKSVKDLMDPSWKGRFVMIDDPGFVFYLLAKANGFDKAPLLTEDQLQTVADQAKQVVANAAAFSSSYQDETDRLVAGDVDLAFDGWEAMITWAKEKGTDVKAGFFQEKATGGWWDGLAIPSGVQDPECALAYIDAVIAASTQAKLATNLVSGATNRKAVPLLPSSMKGLYDYAPMESADAATQFSPINPPEKTPAGIMNSRDWSDAWKEVKASK